MRLDCFFFTKFKIILNFQNIRFSTYSVATSCAYWQWQNFCRLLRYLKLTPIIILRSININFTLITAIGDLTCITNLFVAIRLSSDYLDLQESDSLATNLRLCIKEHTHKSLSKKQVNNYFPVYFLR